MYTIVVCPNCENVKIVKDRPKRTQCGRCKKRHKFRDLKHFYQCEDSDEARQARAVVLAQVNDREAEYERLSNQGVFDGEVERAIDTDEYLEAKGIDVEELDVTDTEEKQRSKSRKEIVKEALNTLDQPERADVLDYAADRDVPREKAEDILDRLRERGHLIESSNGLRLI